MLHDLYEQFKVWIDWLAVGGTVAVMVELIPKLSALVTLIWLCIRVYETNTVQKLVKKYFNKDK